MCVCLCEPADDEEEAWWSTDYSTSLIRGPLLSPSSVGSAGVPRSRLGKKVHTYRQTDRQTHTHTHVNTRMPDEQQERLDLERNPETKRGHFSEKSRGGGREMSTVAQHRCFESSQ